jgi:flagellar basal body-associated protein FliL
MAKDKNENEEEPLTPEEAPGEEGYATDKADKKKKIKKILIIAAPIILAIIGGVYFFFFVIHAPATNENVEIHQESEQPQLKLESNTYLDVDPITIGLTPSGSKKEYLRLDLALRLSSESEGTAILAKMPIIKDTLIIFLRSLRSTDFNSSSSAIYLKEEISKRINKITAPIVVKEVLFQEITVN